MKAYRDYCSGEHVPESSTFLPHGKRSKRKGAIPDAYEFKDSNKVFPTG
jgi:hypothetical protein